MAETGTPPTEPPQDRAPGNPGRLDAEIWSGFAERQRQRRLRLATQSWGEFFRGLALQFAAVLVGVAIWFAIAWFVRG